MGSCYYLGSVNARDMLALAISQGLSYGDDPVVGGVICWDESGGGHCQVIEQVIDNDTVITSDSGWNYTQPPVVTTQTTHRVGGVWVYGAGYTYQGIFYPPRSVGAAKKYYPIWLQGEGYLWR